MASYLDPKSIEFEINGEIKKFYPTSLKAALRLRAVAKAFMTAILAFIQQMNDWNGAQIVESQEETPEGGKFKKTESITPGRHHEVVKLRAEQQERAVQTSIDSLVDAASTGVVAELIVDSMRDDFPEERKDDKKFRAACKKIEEVDIKILSQLLQGVALANKDLFDPLVRAAPERLRDAVRGAVSLNNKPND